MKKLVCVAGPTGSGKTGLGIEIAKKFGGEIISADSMQIYKKLNIGTANPAIDEMEGIPHHLIDIISPFSEFSVKEFVDIANEKIDEILASKPAARRKTRVSLSPNSISFSKKAGKLRAPSKTSGIRPRAASSEEIFSWGSSIRYKATSRA